MTQERITPHAEQLQRYVGRQVNAIRPLSRTELASEGWPDHDPESTAVLIFDDGCALIVQSDAEGNGPGHLRSARVIAGN